MVNEPTAIFDVFWHGRRPFQVHHERMTNVEYIAWRHSGAYVPGWVDAYFEDRLMLWCLGYYGA